MKTIKTVDAVVRPGADTGEFLMILSDDTLDRSGERLFACDWAHPLPAVVPLNVNHSTDVADVVGSGEPYIDSDGSLKVRGTFASTEQAQHIRRLVAEGHVSGCSVEFLRDPDGFNVLVGGAFCNVPCNPNARVLSAKSNHSLGVIDMTDPKAEQFRDAANKAYTDYTAGQITLDAFNTAMDRVEKDADAHRVAVLNRKAANRYAGSADSAGFHGVSSRSVALRDKGRAPSVMVDDDQARQLFAKAQAGEAMTLHTKTLGFSSGDSLLPAQLAPYIVSWIHEKRIMDRLPTIACEAPYFEVIRSYGVSGSAGVVAEGAEKPEVEPLYNSITLPMLKIAAHAALSWEAISDLDLFTKYVQTELPLQLIDTENQQLLYGSGTDQLLGFANTPNILTGNNAGATTVAALDFIEESIEIMRAQPGTLGNPDLLILSPSTWSALRRIKDSYNRYYLSPDPTQQEAMQLWGVPVMTTIQCQAGDGFLIDTSRFGKVVVREAITIRQGLAEDDFIRNLLRWVFEERLNLAVERPNAVNYLTNLPTTSGGGS